MPRHAGTVVTILLILTHATWAILIGIGFLHLAAALGRGGLFVLPNLGLLAALAVLIHSARLTKLCEDICPPCRPSGWLEKYTIERGSRRRKTVAMPQ
jgi:hypothetical protein